MEIKETIAIKTHDAQSFLRIYPNMRRSLFDISMQKIAALHNMAREEKVWAYIHLFEIHILIKALLEKINKQTKQVKKALKKRIGRLPKLSLSTLLKKQYSYSNPIHFGLIQILIQFDVCSGYLFAAKNADVFTHAETYFVLKESIKKECYKLFSSINRIDVKNLPKVGMHQYLLQKNHDIGEIGKLHQASLSKYLPPLSAKILDQFAKLKNTLDSGGLFL
jgi:hypothetical protein